jgi:hypothetical protein
MRRYGLFANDRVTWRYNRLNVTCAHDRGCYRMQLNPRLGGLQDVDRHDQFTAATNFAAAILMRASNVVSLFSQSGRIPIQNRYTCTLAVTQLSLHAARSA